MSPKNWLILLLSDDKQSVRSIQISAQKSSVGADAPSARISARSGNGPYNETRPLQNVQFCSSSMGVNMNSKKWPIIIALLFPVLCFGCGYHFSAGGEHIDQGIQTVFVENFFNRTGEANLENYVRNAFINEFRKGSRFDLANSKETADAFLNGSVNRSTVSHLSYRITDVAKEDRVNVTIEVALKETKNNEIIWINRNFTGEEAFIVDADPSRTETNRKKALRKLAIDMAEKAYRSMMSGF